MSAEKMPSHKEEILADIEVLPRLGSPGRLKLSEGKDVESIITSDDGHVLAAVAMLGLGRIFVIAHAQYVNTIKEAEHENESVTKLHQNLRKWIGKGEEPEKVTVKRVKNLSGDITEGACKVLVWHGGNIEEGMEVKVRKFVEEGGGLIHAICPWGWKQRHQSQSLSEIPLHGILQSVGIEYTEGAIRCNRHGFIIPVVGPNVPKCGEPEAKRVENASHHHHHKQEQQQQRRVVFVEEDLSDDHHDLLLESKEDVPAEWKGYEDMVQTWRSKLLQGVDWLPRYGAPGTCVVYGKESASILSCSSPQNVVIAAGEIGKGRVITITHSDYINKRDQPQVKTLMENVFEWVSHRDYKNDDDLLVLKGKCKSFKGKKILLWLGDRLDEDCSDDVRQFVTSGGGLIHSTAAWGWLSLHKGSKLADIPLAGIVEKAGIFYTRNLSSNEGRFTVDVSAKQCRVEAAQNIGYTLARSKSMKDLETYGEYICPGLAVAPDSVKLQLVDDIQRVYDRNEKSAKMPSFKKPLSDPGERCLVLLCDQLCNMGHKGRRCIPCVDVFPGKCAPGPAICAEREITGKEPDFHNTGLYAVPGVEIEVEVTSGKDTLNDGWLFRVGAHTDQIYKKDRWKRWPNVIKSHPLDVAQFKLFSPYGGLIYLVNPSFKKSNSITVKISGVVEAPQYDLTQPGSQRKWLRCRNDPGPWTDLRGRYISFVMPSPNVKDIDDPGPAMELWDRVVETHCMLRGTDPAHHRHQWVVCDVQPSAGYMHAGYPIVTHLDVCDPGAPDKFLLNVESVLDMGRWGMFHEMGHNMQRRWWTPKKTGEVTVNIFTLHAMDVIVHKDPWIIDWLAKYLPAMELALQKKDPYQDWLANSGIALGIYAQLQHCFGWDAYKKVFRIYEAMEKHPVKNEDVIDCWVDTFSQTVGYNLWPMFEFWGFPLEEDLRKRQTLRPFLPDDEMTRLGPKRVKALEKEYPGLVRKLSDTEADTTCTSF